MKLQHMSAGSVFSKELFHREGSTLLRSLAKRMGLAKGSFQVRSNKAGDAVYGEVTLHAETFYVQLRVDGYPQIRGTERSPVKVLYRSCKGLKDYTGSYNQWTTLKDVLLDLDGFSHTLKAL